MPVKCKNPRYATKNNVRLAFCDGKVVEAKKWYPTSFNAGHKHKWMEGRKYTTIDSKHNHPINEKLKVALKGTTKHKHKLLRK